MQDVSGYIRPKLAEDVREGITTEGISILLTNSSHCSRLAWIVKERQALSDTSSENLGGIEPVVPVVARRDEDAAG